MRGKVPVFGALMLIGRITPAYAGKSVPDSVIVNFVKDHPRLCGEKKVIRQCCYHGGGSPPPMRGKDHPQTGSRTCRRITPAYAGKRPRGGGTPPDPPGSPPPMRGKGMT